MTEARSVPSLLRDSIGPEAWSLISTSPVAFWRYFDPEGNGPWDYQGEFLTKAALTRDDGKFQHRIAAAVWPRQDGKSSVSGWYALWRWFIDDDCKLIVSVALDRSSAAIIQSLGRSVIESSPILSTLIDGRYGLTRSTLRLTDGRRWTIKPSDSKFSRGLRVDLLCADEVGFLPSDSDLVEVISAGMVARPRPQIVLTSTPGLQAGILWETAQRSERGDPTVYLDHVHANRSPLVTPEVLAQQKELLSDWEYRREHEAQWISDAETFVNAEDLQAAMAGTDPRIETSETASAGYLDLGWRQDESALSIAQIRSSDHRVEIVGLHTWKAPKDGTLDFLKLMDDVRDICLKLSCKKLYIESPQAVLLSQTLKIPGCVVELVTPSMQHQQAIWGALHSLLRDRLIHLPLDETLRRQCLGLIREILPSGNWRVVASSRRLHQDRALAVAGACWAVQEFQSSLRAGGLMFSGGKIVDMVDRTRDVAGDNAKRREAKLLSGRSKWIPHSDRWSDMKLREIRRRFSKSDKSAWWDEIQRQFELKVPEELIRRRYNLGTPELEILHRFKSWSEWYEQGWLP